MLSERDLLLKKGEFQFLRENPGTTFEEQLASISACTRLGDMETAQTLLNNLTELTPAHKIQKVLSAADGLQAAGRHTEIIELFNTFELPSDAPDDQLKFFHLRRGEILQMFESHERALQELTKAANAAQRDGDAVRELFAIETSIESLRSLRMDLASEQAAELVGEKSLALFPSVEDSLDLSKIAECVSNYGGEDESLEIFQKAYDIAEAGGHKWDLAFVLLSWSRFDEFCADSDNAIEKTTRALQLFQEMEAIPMQLISSDQLSSQLANVGRIDEALDTLHNVCDFANFFGDHHFYLNTLAKSAYLAFEAGENVRALDIIAQIIETCAERDLRPNFLENLMREAYRNCESELIEEKLGQYAEREDEYDL